MSRVFTFGCSFTDYNWPTWADMILYKNKGINYGICGGGFEQIMNSLIQCDIDFKLKESDHVVIVYPNLLRWDMPFYPRMLCLGNALTSPWKDHLDKMYSIEGLTYKNLNLIVMIDYFLKSKKVKVHYSSIFPIFENPENYFMNIEFGDKIKSHLEFVQNTVMKNQLPDFYTFLYGNDNKSYQTWQGTKKWKDKDGIDYHPTTISHYKWLTEVLIPELKDVSLKISLDEVAEIENTLINELEYDSEASEYFRQKGYFNNKIFVYQALQDKLKNLI
jgi:hypothetical protein